MDAGRTVLRAVSRAAARLFPALALSLAGAAPALAQAVDGVRVMTLAEALALAAERDPAAVAAAGATSTARAELRQAAVGAWLPTLTVNSGYSNSSNQRFDQASGQLVSESFTAQTAVSYELFSGGRRLADRRGADADMDAALALERAQEFQTALTVKEAFFGAAAAAEIVNAARQRLERARQQLTFASTRLEVGSATRSDILRAELEVGNSELAVVDAETALRTSQLNLGRRVGLDRPVQPAAGSLPERAPALAAMPTLVGRASETAPSAVAARASYVARRADTSAARASYLPSLRATGGYDWLAFSFPPSNQSWSYRLTLSMPLFNGLQRETSVARARAAERAAQARARDAEIAARNQAESSAREVESAERRVEISARAVELAREDLRVQEERYQIGSATILDLQTSQLALAEAEVGWVRARQALGTAVARLEAVLGESVTAESTP